ncbi:neutral zinc metallopeptidase [Jatrophihabitans telluris]|uniref:Neutral zinc metallopeptidase n=1 Tax=Jatrophihabitans telluris TaxID=2038343 RepID=A0ABY4R326_9ACTN|nr:neutral zinc metallopeptidase [Jatrophihabitans telluris]UQX90199.1 neutral zinc metallopeptidase [Jatrophihabitans telluris]
MQYNDDAQLDTSVVQDVRSSGRGLPGGVGGLAVGGGGIGIVGVIIVVLLNVLGGGGGSSGLPGGIGGLGDVGVGTNTASVNNSQLQQSCKTGKDANSNSDCAIVADIDSIESYWSSETPTLGAGYAGSPTVFFRGQISTGCGAADAGVGPFYCPADKKVYIDLSFFDELKTKFGAEGGAFVNAYVLAHEYGHHVQDLLGIESKIDHQTTGPKSDSVKLELQADCFAGVWANHATTVPSANGKPLIASITSADVAAALDTAGRIGDDWIQSHLGSGANPSSYTHGTSTQRKKWFSTGYSGGDPAGCDTFSASSLG